MQSLTFREVWWTVTPAWAVLVLSRVLFYGLERRRYPELIPPVYVDAIQGVLLWPLAALGCYCALRTWTRAGLLSAVAMALLTTAFLGSIARIAYAAACLITPFNVETQRWLQSFHAPAAGHWYPWVSNAVEYGVLYLSCVVAAAGFLSYRSLMNERLLRTRVEATAAQDRLRALRAQLNPHFLFNALNSIASLSDSRDEARSELKTASTQQLITQLSTLLRRTLRASECEEHELSEELAYVEAYLQIQQIRHPSRIVWGIGPDADCARKLVPSLILLPLVENAVTHGLRGGMHVVRIDIDAWRERAGLSIRVRNTCCRLTPPDDGTHSGMGLRHAQERLQVLFGGAATLRAHRMDPDRFEARLTMPLTNGHAATLHDQEVLCAS